MSLLDNENKLLEQADNSVKDWHQRELDKSRETMSWTFKMFDFSDASKEYEDSGYMYGDYKIVKF